MDRRTSYTGVTAEFHTRLLVTIGVPCEMSNGINFAFVKTCNGPINIFYLYSNDADTGREGVPTNILSLQLPAFPAFNNFWKFSEKIFLVAFVQKMYQLSI